MGNVINFFGMIFVIVGTASCALTFAVLIRRTYTDRPVGRVGVGLAIFAASFFIAICGGVLLETVCPDGNGCPAAEVVGSKWS